MKIGGAALALVLGQLRLIAPWITGIYGVLSVLSAGMFLFPSAQNNREAYGAPVVLLRRTENRGITSSLPDLCIAAFGLTAAYAHLLLTPDDLHIPR